MNMLYQLPSDIVINNMFDMLSDEDAISLSLTAKLLNIYFCVARKLLKQVYFENYSTRPHGYLGTPYYRPLKSEYQQSALVITTTDNIFRWRYTKKDGAAIVTERITSLTELPVTPIKQIVSINSGQSFFIIDTNLKLWGLGRNPQGLLGIREERQRRTFNNPLLIPALSTLRISSIHCESFPLIFVITKEEQIYYWGHEANATPTLLITEMRANDILGLVVNPDTSSRAHTPILTFSKTMEQEYLNAIASVKQVGRYISADGHMYVWGRGRRDVRSELDAPEHVDVGIEPTVVPSLPHEHVSQLIIGPYEAMRIALCRSGNLYLNGKDYISRTPRVIRKGYSRFYGLPYMKIIKVVHREQIIFVLTDCGLIYGWGYFHEGHLVSPASHQFSDGSNFRGYTYSPIRLKSLSHIKFVDLICNDSGLWIAISERGRPYYWSINTRLLTTNNIFTGSRSSTYYTYYTEPKAIPTFRPPISKQHTFEKRIRLLRRATMTPTSTQEEVKSTERKQAPVEKPAIQRRIPPQRERADIVGNQHDNALYSLVYEVIKAAKEMPCDSALHTASTFIRSPRMQELLTPFHLSIVDAITNYFDMVTKGRGLLTFFYTDWWGGYSQLKSDVGLLLKIFQCFYPELYDTTAIPHAYTDFGMFATDGLVLDVIEQMVESHNATASWQTGFYKSIDEARQQELSRRDKVMRRSSRSGTTLTLFFSAACDMHLQHKYKEALSDGNKHGATPTI